MENSLTLLRTWKAATHSVWEAKIIEKVIRAVFSTALRTCLIGMEVAWVTTARRRKGSSIPQEGQEVVNNKLLSMINCNIKVNCPLIPLSEKELNLHLEMGNPLGNLQTTKWECPRSHPWCRKASKLGVEPVVQLLDLKKAATSWMRV